MNKQITLGLTILIVITVIYLRWQALLGLVKNLVSIYIGGIEGFYPKRDVQLSFFTYEIKVNEMTIPHSKLMNIQVCNLYKLTAEQKQIILKAAKGSAYENKINSAISNLDVNKRKKSKFKPDFIIISYKSEQEKDISAVFILKSSMNKFDIHRAIKRVKQRISPLKSETN